jgi:hypothetical protein
MDQLAASVPLLGARVLKTDLCHSEACGIFPEGFAQSFFP